MRAFGEIVMTTPGILLRLGMLLLGYWELYLAILVIRRRRRAPVIAVGAGQLLLWFFAFVLLLDGSFDGKLGHRLTWPGISLWAYRLPWGLWAGLLVLGILACTLESWEHWRYGRSHLGPNAIKEAVDLLPAGVCFGREGTLPTLTNLWMTDCCRDLTGQDLTDCGAFWRFLCQKGEERDGRYLIRDQQGRSLLFAREPVHVDGEDFWQLTGFDVSESVSVIDQLRDSNRRLLQLREHMETLSRLGEDVFAQRELLDARVALHDEFGELLLLGRLYFEQPDQVDEEDLLRRLRHANAYVLRDAAQEDLRRDELTEALHTAQTIGVRAELTGPLPDGPGRELLAHIIRESAANTVKHASGDRVKVALSREGEELVIRVENNGLPPAKPVQPSGGLRSLAEEARGLGGQLEIESDPAFRLTARIPWKSEK